MSDRPSSQSLTPADEPMSARDWDTLEHLIRMPCLRPEMAQALQYYLEYDGTQAMPVNYETNLEAARTVIANLASEPR